MKQGDNKIIPMHDIELMDEHDKLQVGAIQNIEDVPIHLIKAEQRKVSENLVARKGWKREINELLQPGPAKTFHAPDSDGNMPKGIDNLNKINIRNQDDEDFKINLGLKEGEAATFENSRRP